VMLSRLPVIVDVYPTRLLSFMNDKEIFINFLKSGRYITFISKVFMRCVFYGIQRNVFPS
jgi:hypothetical protein